MSHMYKIALVVTTLMVLATRAVAGGSATTTMGVSAIVPRVCFDQSDSHRPVDQNSEIDPMGKPTGRICNYPVNPGYGLTSPSDPIAPAVKNQGLTTEAAWRSGRGILDRSEMVDGLRGGQ